MKKKLKILSIIVIVISLFIYMNYNLYVLPKTIMTKAYTTSTSDRSSKTSEELLKEIYKTSFKLSQNNPGSINSYVPKLNFLSTEQALYYFNLFNIKEISSQTEDYYLGENKEGKLKVYKYDSLLEYIPNNDMIDNDYISQKEAIKIGEEFISNKFLFLAYEESHVEESENGYTVKYINRIGNIKNHAFNTSVKMDKTGNIESLLYSFIKFEKLADFKTITMAEAFNKLPFEGIENVVLNKCDFVYVYDASIVQPAYIFTGVTNNGETFLSVVNASIFQ